MSCPEKTYWAVIEIFQAIKTNKNNGWIKIVRTKSADRELPQEDVLDGGGGCGEGDKQACGRHHHLYNDI